VRATANELVNATKPKSSISICGTYTQALLVKKHLQIVRQLRRPHESERELHEQKK
jgi:hypothetical protein